MRRLIFVTLTSLLLANFVSITANAGGGCGFSTPEISKSLVKPGESFTVDFSFIQYDSNINYEDPIVAPEVNFSSSFNYLKQKMVFRGMDGNNWAQYRATFQIPSDYVGNQNLQSIVLFPRCGGKVKDNTFGPYLTIQSSNTIPTCTIQELQVNDYSVRSGEAFKVGFKVYSSIENLNPVIELTDYMGVKRFNPRLAGKSGSDIKLYEATVSYDQNYQYPYGAIARAEVKGLCNSSGQRQVIGSMSYVTSQAIVQPIYPGFACELEGSKVLTNTEQATTEELFCTQDASRGNSLRWLDSVMILQINQESNNAELCEKLYAAKMVANQRYYCVLREGNQYWTLEKDMKSTGWQELKAIQSAKNQAFLNQILKAKKSNPEKISLLDKLWSEFKQSFNSVPTSMRDSIQEFAYVDAQFDLYLQRLKTIMATQTIKPSTVKSKLTITCAKGKLIKKVTATSPKCPFGYKQK